MTFREFVRRIRGAPLPNHPTYRPRLRSWREDPELEDAIEHHRLMDDGLLDPGQPTRHSHRVARRTADACPEIQRALHACAACRPQEFDRRSRRAIGVGAAGGPHDD
jgi:hypothetical protein